MTYYREVYKNSKRWTGEPLAGKTLIIYCEQGLGDTIQFARFFKLIEDANIILHAPKALHRLLLSDETCMWGCIDKDCEELPAHDYHVLSMSLPFILKDKKPSIPYFTVPPYNLGKEFEGTKKIGICWEGNPEHPRNMERSCPLRLFRGLEQPDRKFFMIHKEIQTPELTSGAEGMDLSSIPIEDLWDTARLISAMDVIISVDTAALHLAGAMGKLTFGLLDKDYDYRWRVRNWYPTIALLFQGKQGDWITVFAGLMMLVDTILSGTKQKEPVELTTMIGESFLSPDKA